MICHYFTVLFNEFLYEHAMHCEYLPVLTEETVRGVIAKLNMKVKTQTIVDYVMGRYALIK